ncbi:MAG: tyrosine-type recombinase/integrase, partial [Oscillospiraceae bacterium]
VTPHILRHTYITALCSSGLDIKKIQYLAGHADPAMTLKVYTHVTHNRPDELIGAIRGAFPAGGLGVNLGVNRKRLRVKRK